MSLLMATLMLVFWTLGLVSGVVSSVYVRTEELTLVLRNVRKYFLKRTHEIIDGYMTKVFSRS